ncbi:MAG TPA: long-chain fatty acid--CoA ligase [Candidatus Sulfopaludibacter sp.]|nr:long-chain fatty acid--CoA ligase [Candidatus Sulfopaludibacter sp.]
MLSTMQDSALTVQSLFLQSAAMHAGSRVSAFDGEGDSHTTYADLAGRVTRLAAALRRFGIQPGDRVGTFCWNTPPHLEAYFAIPGMGAVLHTLNVRLFPDQLSYIVNHAADRIIIVDASLVPVLAKAAGQFRTVERYFVIGDACEPLPGECLDYEVVLAGEQLHCDWPEIDERSAAGMCYTSGTTGNPKGVVYSHRSIYLHSMAVVAPSCVGFSSCDRLLAVPSMFHANSWGLLHAAWMAGADIVFPGRYLQAAPLCRLIEDERPTVSAGVPTIWNEVVRYADDHEVDFSSLRLVLSAGSAVPRSLIEAFRRRHGVRLVQGWGMTETSPLVTIGHPPQGCPEDGEIEYHSTAGRILPGCELRIAADDGGIAPRDGETVGEIEVRGPWITGSYLGDPAPERFHDGWLRTGDVGTLDARGYLRIKDRTKDVIKSGGEWVSSVELENAIMAHPDVIESAVIGVPDARWDERPLACVVLKPGAQATAGDLRTFLVGRVAKWWIPERWAFVPEIPKTSVGKFDKKVLRSRQAAGEIAVADASNR